MLYILYKYLLGTVEDMIPYMYNTAATSETGDRPWTEREYRGAGGSKQCNLGENHTIATLV